MRSRCLAILVLVAVVLPACESKPPRQPDVTWESGVRALHDSVDKRLAAVETTEKRTFVELMFEDGSVVVIEGTPKLTIRRGEKDPEFRATER